MQPPALSYQDRNSGEKIGHPRRMKQPSSQGFHRSRKKDVNEARSANHNISYNHIYSDYLIYQIIGLAGFHSTRKVVYYITFIYFHWVPHGWKNP